MQEHGASGRLPQMLRKLRISRADFYRGAEEGGGQINHCMAKKKQSGIVYDYVLCRSTIICLWACCLPAEGADILGFISRKLPIGMFTLGAGFDR